MNQNNGILRRGAHLVTSHQAPLWWLFAVNLVLGYFASMPVRSQLSFLDRSLASGDLYHKMDIAAIWGVLARPEVTPSAAAIGSFSLSLVYLVFALLLTGGILGTYYSDRSLSTGEFFRDCGEYFWRMLRLLLIFAIALIPIFAIFQWLRTWTNRLSDEAPQERLGFWVFVAGEVILLLVALALRLWFDMAQVHAVAENQRAIRRSLRATFHLMRRGRLFGAFVLINVCCSVVAILLFVAWTRVPHERVGVSLLLGEILVFVWIAFRLWERGVEVAYYQRTRPVMTPLAEVEQTAPLESKPPLT